MHTLILRMAPRISAAAESATRARLYRLRWLAWPAASAAAAALLFFTALSRATRLSTQSDGASIMLQAWAMLHGNLLLHGWVLADVSFYTTQLPEYMLVEAVRGLRPDVVPICASLTYTLLVLLAAFVAKGRARGREGVVRAVLTGGIMFAPALSVSGALLTNPDHVGTAVPVLVAAALIDRARPRWYVAVAVALVLALALVADSLALLIGVVPLLLVSLVRSWQGVVIRREALASRWYELSLAAAALAALAISSLATSLIRASGGWTTATADTRHFVQSSFMPANVAATAKNFVSLFSGDFFGMTFSQQALFAGVHLAGAALVAVALFLALQRFFRPGDLIAGMLAAAIAINLVAYLVIFYGSGATIREITPVFSLGAVLAGRLLAGPLIARRLEPLLAVGLACYAFTLGPTWLAWSHTPPANAGLAAWLEEQHLSSGLAGYWQANSVMLDSRNTITMRPVRLPIRPYPSPPGWNPGSRLGPDRWEIDTRLFNPRESTANFLVAAPPGSFGGNTVTGHEGIATFGKPARTYHHDGFVILVWNKNLLRVLARQ